MSEYIHEKILLLHDFGIKLTSIQRKHLYSLHTESEVDRYVRDLICPPIAPDIQHAVWCGNV